jgi:2-polyprenyl-3-methyl-5-hydroxy-6-metoxy-1,4-benzoquinol methylase
MAAIDPNAKRSHASADIAHRERKADKIRHLIEQIRPLQGCQVLEVGAGAGVISRSLARAVGPSGAVTAVDVVDERVVHDGYRFLQVEDTTLPFADASFEIVVSNHVIEHVGPRPIQMDHLREIHRVLRPSGLLYLAAPNKWTVMEPHFRLPLLSWLPRALAHRYVRMTGRGTQYDCWPRGPRGLRTLLTETGFAVTDVLPAAVRLEAAQRTDIIARVLHATPPTVLSRLGLLMPSLIFLAAPAIGTASARP